MRNPATLHCPPAITPPAITPQARCNLRNAAKASGFGAEFQRVTDPIAPDVHRPGEARREGSMTDVSIHYLELSGAWQPLPLWAWRALFARRSLSFAFSMTRSVWGDC
jgi:hypothetical protein